MEYNNLSLCTLTPEQNRRTRNYWFTIDNNCTAHTAFNKQKSLQIWLEERGLKLKQELPAHGEHSVQKIEGSYIRKMHMSYDEFYSLPAIIETRAPSNGDYTLALITETGGLRTVHILNPNCKFRRVYNYSESRAMFG